MIRMYHDNPAKTGGPVTADVPEPAVAWMKLAGWYEKQEAEPKAAEKAEPGQPKKARVKK